MTHQRALELLRLASATRRRAERNDNFAMAVNAQTAMRRIMEWLHKEQGQ